MRVLAVEVLESFDKESLKYVLVVHAITMEGLCQSNSSLLIGVLFVVWVRVMISVSRSAITSSFANVSRRQITTPQHAVRLCFLLQSGGRCSFVQTIQETCKTTCGMSGASRKMQW